MMTKHRVFLLALMALVMIAATSNPVLGKEPRGRHDGFTEDQKARIAEIRKATWADIQAVLTEEQRKQLEQMKGEGGGPAHHGRPRGKARRGGMVLKNFDLTEEQKTKIQEIRQAAWKQVQEADSPEARQTIRQDVQAILTEDQRKQLEQMKGKGRRSGRMLKKLNLTEEQKTKSQEIRQAARKQVQEADSREARRAIFQKMRQDVQAILTEDQRKQLEQMKGKGRRSGRMLKKLNLTEEQKMKFQEIRQAARKQVQEADSREARRTIFQKMRQDVQAILTEDQRKQLEQMKAEGLNRWRKGRFRPKDFGRQRAPKPEDPDPIKPDTWAMAVKIFIEAYQLDKSQQTMAWSVHADRKPQALAYLQDHRVELTEARAAVEQLSRAEATQPAERKTSEALRARLDQLEKPLRGIFEQLMADLIMIPTEEQITAGERALAAAAGEGKGEGEGKPTTKPKGEIKSTTATQKAQQE